MSLVQFVHACLLSLSSLRSVCWLKQNQKKKFRKDIAVRTSSVINKLNLDRVARLMRYQ